MEAIKNMNGTIWIFAALLVGMVVVQACIFLKLALDYNKKLQVLTKEDIRLATRTGFVAAIGPSFGILPVVIALIVLVGSGTAFMRCGVIGAAPFELMMASLTAQAAGVEFGTAEFTEGIFTLCLFGMAWASAPYALNTILTLKTLDKAVARDAKTQKRSFIPYMSNGAMMAILVCQLMDRFNTVAGVGAGVSAGVAAFVVQRIVKKTGNKVLASFSIAIAMICAMVVGQGLTMLTA